ncbi:MAG: hypothetical protein AAB444_00235 [Patescibacteria group bacterium]
MTNKFFQLTAVFIFSLATLVAFPSASSAQVSCSAGEIYCASLGACTEPITNPACAPQHRNADQCNACTSCVSGYQDCSGVCTNMAASQNTTPNCTDYSFCTGNCTTCDPGYSLTGTTCTVIPVYVSLQSAYPGTVESGNFNVSGNGRLGGDVYLVNGKALRVDAAGATALNFGNWGAGATGFTAHVFGDFLADGDIASGGMIRGDFVGAAGTSCVDNEILKKVSGAWQCSSVSGAIVNETDPIFTAWQTAPTLASLTMTGELQVAGYSTPPASGVGAGSLIYDSTDGTLKFWNGTTWKSVLADGAGPASPWVTSGGDIYNTNTGNVGIGIVAPAERLEVAAGSGTTARLRVSDLDPGQNPELQLEYADGLHWAMYADKMDNSKLKFWQNGINALVIDPSGIHAANNISAGGNIRADGCFGPVFQEVLSSLASSGAAGGYSGANAKCPLTMHVCTTTEMLNSINCGTNFGGISGDDAANGIWVSAGAASLPTPTNDCNGWTSGESTWQGIHYIPSVNGGNFYARTCDAVLKFACCR